MGNEYKCFVCGGLHGEQHYRTGSYNGVGIITKNNKRRISNAMTHIYFLV